MDRIVDSLYRLNEVNLTLWTPKILQYVNICYSQLCDSFQFVKKQSTESENSF